MSPLFDFDPFREMEQLQRRMDRLFQTLWGEPPLWRAGVYPLVNISETKDHVFVRAELPGVKPENLEITLKNQNLVIRGERQITSEGEEVNYHRRERESGYFRRVVRLPVPVDSNQVEATMKDGILTVTLAKPEEVKPRQIQVKSA
jgi:HSP20 family protein|uniref:Hsp20/alpha crystallin family protein n=1 Tax=Desulfobacca acetoxidans TaxID=60893 RepID=A0A7V6A3S3_9BACT